MFMCLFCRVRQEEYEKATNSCFIKDCGEKRSNLYYYCNRSGHFKSRSTGIRHLKTQGTSKISGYCTAAIIVQIKSDNCLNQKKFLYYSDVEL